jgi:uncharacterized protein (DUF1697 family)
LASVVFLRGVNVGGHKTFRPTEVVRALAPLEVVSIGAAGTFVVLDSVAESELRARFAKCLGFTATVCICRARQVLELVKGTPFSHPLAAKADGEFVSVLAGAPQGAPKFPLLVPTAEKWQVAVLDVHGPFALSVIRRTGKALLYPNEVVEKHFGVAGTTRNWQTILKIAAVLEGPERLRRG